MAQGRQARLFTTAGIDTDRDAAARALEALLATASVVPALATRLLGAVGVRVDNRTEVTATVGHPVGTAKRPPAAGGALTAAKGRSSATVVFDAQAGDRGSSPATVRKLRDAAKGTDVVAVVTIGNRVEGPDLGRSRSEVKVVHWPWNSVLAAIVDEKVRDAEQAAVLGDLVGFLRDPDARIATSGDMGPNWVSVAKTARTSRLSARDAKVVDVARRWDQVTTGLAAHLGSVTGRDVQLALPAKVARDDAARVSGIVDRLADDGRLEAVFSLPDAAGELAVVADLTAQRLVSVAVVEPPDRLGERATIGWLLDSLAGAPTDAVVEAWTSRGRQAMAVATLADLDDDPGLLDTTRRAESFRVLMADEMPAPRAGRSEAFIEAVTGLAEETWKRVLGPLSGEDVPRRSAGKTSSQTTRRTTSSSSSRTSGGRTTRTTSERTTTSSSRTSSSSSRKRSTSSQRTSTSRSTSSRSTAKKSSSKRKSAADLAKELRREG